MKTSRYLQFILTIIAINLTLMTLKEFHIITPSYASGGEKTFQGAGPVFTSENKYALVPLNAQGTVDVNIVSSSATLDVNIEEVGGWSTWGKVPVVIKENEDKCGE